MQIGDVPIVPDKRALVVMRASNAGLFPWYDVWFAGTAARPPAAPNPPGHITLAAHGAQKNERQQQNRLEDMHRDLVHVSVSLSGSSVRKRLSSVLAVFLNCESTAIGMIGNMSALCRAGYPSSVRGHFLARC